jgi:hypothetical protein
MKYFLLLILIGSAFAKEPTPDQCIPPAKPFVEEKLRNSYNLGLAEQELKDIVKDEKNYALREEVKSLKRRVMFSKRREQAPLISEIQTKFDQMILNVVPEEVIVDFPIRGASSTPYSSEDGDIIMSMNNLPQAELDFIPPETLKKLGKNVNVHYKYPYDTFDYYVTYEGNEVPLDRALQKMLDEFEDACILRMMENKRIKGIEKATGGVVSQ